MDVIIDMAKNTSDFTRRTSNHWMKVYRSLVRVKKTGVAECTSLAQGVGGSRMNEIRPVDGNYQNSCPAWIVWIVERGNIRSRACHLELSIADHVDKMARVGDESLSHRIKCRMDCGAGIVIQNVLPFLWIQELRSSIFTLWFEVWGGLSRPRPKRMVGQSISTDSRWNDDRKSTSWSRIYITYDCIDNSLSCIPN